MLSNIVLAIIVAGLVIVAGGYLAMQTLSKENVVAKVKERTPFKLEHLSDQNVIFTTVVDFVNEGDSCAVMEDCIVRPHLPYEQYDCVETWGHADLLSAPREDDYFEATILQKKGYKNGMDRIQIRAQIELVARKGMKIRDAVSKLPDFNFQIIWLESGRTPEHYRQVRIEVPGKEIAKMIGAQHSNY